MILHSNGGRQTSNTIEYQLAAGRRFGFVASTDDHFGYPGAWGEGIVGVWAKDLSSASLFEAIRSRRTYAATGDRIRLEFTLNGKPMGSELPDVRERRLKVAVEAEDSIRMIELVKNGRVIRRHFPEDAVSGPIRLPGRVKCRLQYGWGPWATLALERIARWDMEVSLDRGTFLGANGCFQSGPFDEELRDRIELVDDRTIRIRSFTSRKQAYLEDPTKSAVLELDAPADAVMTVRLREPADLTAEAKVGELAEDNLITFTGVFTTESFVLGRLVRPEELATVAEWEDEGTSGRGGDFYYVRVTQYNGQLAWSSPIWVG